MSALTASGSSQRGRTERFACGRREDETKFNNVFYKNVLGAARANGFGGMSAAVKFESGENTQQRKKHLVLNYFPTKIVN